MSQLWLPVRNFMYYLVNFLMSNFLNQEAVKEIMEKLPYMKELMDIYCGPDRVTAKQQQQELERVAKTLPENAASSVKRFTERALLSLQVVFIFIILYVSIWTMIFTRIKPFFFNRTSSQCIYLLQMFQYTTFCFTLYYLKFLTFMQNYFCFLFRKIHAKF